jgi:hypothetical protein
MEVCFSSSSQQSVVRKAVHLDHLMFALHTEWLMFLFPWQYNVKLASFIQNSR